MQCLCLVELGTETEKDLSSIREVTSEVFERAVASMPFQLKP